jgi:hypothetical protein
MEITLSIVVGFLIICGLWIALLASRAQLEAQREQTKKLTKRNSELQQSVQRLSRQMDQSIEPLFTAKESIPSTLHTSTDGHVCANQFASDEYDGLAAGRGKLDIP